jgi:LCP family protein required for cell wall assembly
VHARRTRIDSTTLDRRRLLSAGLSALVPGLGQLVDRRPRLAAIFLVPAFILVLVIALLLATRPLASLAASVANPAVLGAVLTLNVVLLAMRLLSVGISFADTRRAGPTGRLGILGVALIAVFVITPHLLVYRYGTALGDTFARVFEPGDSVDPSARPAQVPTGPGRTERLNVLLIGVDSLPWRPATLTDTMMVVSLDPVGKTVSMVSVPRDLIGVPLGNGDEYGPKLNSLMFYGDEHPEEFPEGGIQALMDAIGALLEIDVHYYAKMDFYGFVEMVDAVGGVEVTVTDAWDDPLYDGFGLEERGYAIDEGTHILDGENALAYARARRGVGESDFTRAGRQQEIIIALRDAVTKDGSLLWELPDLLEAVGNTVTTDVPRERLPELAALVDEIENDDIVRAVIRHPLVRSRNTQYGSSLVPRLGRIREVAANLFSEPGVEPIPWPTPTPTPEPEPAEE